MRRSNHENIDVLMLIGLVTGGGEGGEGGGKSHSKDGTRWVRQSPDIYHVEKCEIHPHVDKFRISPQHIILESRVIKSNCYN